MPDPIRWRTQLVLAKTESVYATDPTPTGGANAILMKNVSFQPMEGEDVSRDLVFPYLGAQEEFKVGLRSVLTGTVELVGSGSTGVAPKWSPLFRACGIAEEVTPDDDPGDGTVEYLPATEDHESISVYFWIGPTLHKMVGVRGNPVVNVTAQDVPGITLTLTGLWVGPADTAVATPDLTGFKKPLVATKANTPTFTVGSVPLVLRSFSFNLGNDVQPRLLIGKEEIAIVDRTEEITATVEAVPLATFDPFERAVGLTDTPVTLAHDTRAGHKTTIAIPHASVKRLQGYENQQGILEWPLRITPLPVTGDDQWSITLT